jgi:hypothetical protein
VISGDAIRKTRRRPPALQFQRANRGGRCRGCPSDPGGWRARLLESSRSDPLPRYPSTLGGRSRRRAVVMMELGAVGPFAWSRLDLADPGEELRTAKRARPSKRSVRPRPRRWRRARAPRPKPSKPEPPARDSAGEGLSRRCHPPISAPRSETRSRPEVRAAKLLLSSVGFVSFRAPIDSVMDPGGRPRRPKDLFCLFVAALAGSKGLETRRLTLGRCFNRSAVPHRNKEFVKSSKVR